MLCVSRNISTDDFAKFQKLSINSHGRGSYACLVMNSASMSCLHLPEIPEMGLKISRALLIHVRKDLMIS